MLCHYSTVVTPLSTNGADYPCRSRAVRDGLRGTASAALPSTPITRERLASAPNGQGRRRRCGHDRRPRPRGRRARPSDRRRLPGADPALPPAGLGRARPGRDLGLRPGHPGRGRGPPCRGERDRRGHRHHQPARDPGDVRPLDGPAAAPGDRLAGSPDRAAVRRVGRRRPPAARAATTGLVLDPYFSATKAAWLLREGDLPLAASDPDLSFCTVDTWILWNLTGGAAGGTYATDPSNASRTLLLDTATLAWSAELCDLFCVPADTLPEVRPSAGRFGAAAVGGPRPRCPQSSTGSPSRACSATSRPLFGRPASSPAWSRSPTARAASCSPMPARSARPRPRVSPPAARVGPRRARAGLARPRRLCTRGLGLRLGRGHPVAARRARHHRVGRRGRPTGGVGPRQRRCHLRAGPHRPRQPVVGSPGASASSPASPVAPAGPRSPGPAWRRWRSRYAT